MKTIRIMILCQGLFILFLSIYSCKKTDVSSKNSDENNFVAASTVYQDLTAPSQRIMDCSADCINPEGPYVESSATTSSSWGGPNQNAHTKTVSYVAYNTATDFIVKVTYVKSGQNTNASNLVKVTANGIPQSVPTLASGATATFTFPLPAGWKKCDEMSFAVRQEGQNSPINMTGTYKLFGICAARCATSFTGEAISCGNAREAVYRFTATEDMDYIKIQGGLTNFTGADAEVTIDGGDLTASQSTPGGSSNRVIKIEGKVTACEQVTIRIKWNSTNSGGVITGSWSVKDANGVEVAPSVAGLECDQ
jgi:hypothetical protein